MNKLLSVVAITLTASVVCAEEAEKQVEQNAVAIKQEVPKASFTTLPFCRRVEGVAEVCKPGEAWKEAEEGKYYPLGSSYRTGENGMLVLAFGSDSTVTLGANSEFATRVQPLGEKSRTIALVRGSLGLKLSDNLPEGSFFIAASGFAVRNPVGESKFVYNDKGDGDVVRIRCVTGSLSIVGRHFSIPQMRSADEILIRTSHDHLATFLYGKSGDCTVALDQGMRTKEEIDDNGQVKRSVEKGVTEWRLSPKTKVMINRAVPAIGERMSVHTIAFDAAGERKSECYFCEGRAEINSGEMVVKEKSDGDELAKRAAEATETTAPNDAEEGASEKADVSEDNSSSNE